MSDIENSALTDAAELIGLARARLKDIGRGCLADHLDFCLDDIAAEVVLIHEFPPCQPFAHGDIGEAQVERRPWFGVYKNNPQA